MKYGEALAKAATNVFGCNLYTPFNKNHVFLKELEIDIQVAKVIEAINKSIVYNRIIKL